MFQLLGQTYDSYSTSPATDTAAAGTAMVVVFIYLAVIALMLVAAAKLFMKAGRKWWEAIVPIYNIYVQLKIVGRPGWWLVLYFIPFVNIVVAIINTFDLAKAFGRGIGTGLLLLFFPFIMMPVMAFGSEYTYQGPEAGEGDKTIPDTPYPTSDKAASDTTGPQPPTQSEPAPDKPEPPQSTPPTGQ